MTEDTDLPETAEETIAGLQRARRDRLKAFLRETDDAPTMRPCDRCGTDIWAKTGRQRTPSVERHGFRRLCPRCEVTIAVEEGWYDTDADDSEPADQERDAPPTEPTPAASGEPGTASTLGDFA